MDIKPNFETSGVIIEKLLKRINLLEIQQQKLMVANHDLLLENERTKMIGELIQEESDALNVKLKSCEMDLRERTEEKGRLEIEVLRLRLDVEHTTNMKIACVFIISLGLLLYAVCL